jgi:L-asparaginase II
VAEVIRNGFVESQHHGSVVLTGPDGTIEWSLGAATAAMFPRSSNKPMQAVGMLRAGLGLGDELLALAGGSHAGESIHVEGVRQILTEAGLDESALRNPRAYPFDGKARNAWVRAGNRRARVTMTCSGKHAAMLLTCARNGWPTDSYLDPGHPVQQHILAAIEDCAGERAASVAVDGCGAPLVAISLAGLARAFGRIAAAPPDTPEGQVARAFRRHPEYASGTRRLSATLIRSVPGLFCKTGAEGVIAVGLPDGRGIAVKVNDGASRARPVVLAAMLGRLGLDNEVIRAQRERPVRGGRGVVGVVRPSEVLAGPSLVGARTAGVYSAQEL